MAGTSIKKLIDRRHAQRCTYIPISTLVYTGLDVTVLTLSRVERGCGPEGIV